MTSKTALTNVRVFDGNELTEPRTVVIDGSTIGTDTTGAELLDAEGAVLVPGFIDGHVHLHGRENLQQLSAHGVTTALDMAIWPAERLAALRGIHGLTDIRSAGLPAIGEGGVHAKMFGLPEEAIMRTVDEARRFVAARLAQGVDYIKLIAEAPGEGGPNQDVLNEIVKLAHENGLKAVTHVTSLGAVEMALLSGTDIITHVPVEAPFDEDLAMRVASAGCVAIPTLTMMDGVQRIRGNPDGFAANCIPGVTALHAAGVTIVAGTDAHAQEGVPNPVAHGESLTQELEHLVSAGLSTVEALRAATSNPAEVFGLTDRGRIEPGMRADLVLLDGDPLEDITATRRIRAVWCAGIRRS
nr:amidohydrolase family protein [Kibdelosporangium sp. MJ126-NF4]CEL17177.1 Amidohydrolase precursor [Kibdelosporangium sp. MJ126-NF4]CTQ91593.1 Amidohydrolase precursor [Kibdelosporangium sp. MJ126-NF4]